jgi:cytochrome c
MRRVLGQVMLVGCAVLFVAANGAEAQGKTSWSGVYTAAQAGRGQELYTKQCAVCHKADLSGNEQAKPDPVPPLVAKELALSFGDQGLDTLTNRIKTTMPKGKPNSLTTAQVTDIVAYLLQKGEMPAGSAELPADEAAQKAITFVPTKP